MRTISLCIFLLLTFVSYSQTDELDSLKKVIEGSPNDSTKVNALIDLGRAYANRSPESAIHFYNDAKRLSEKIGYTMGVALSLKYIGNVQYNRGTYLDAVSFWQQAMAVFDSIGNKEGVANIQSNIGAVYFNQGEDLKANEYYFQALETAEGIQDTLRMATVTNNIAAVYQRKDNTQDKAKEFYLRGLALGKLLQDPADRNDIVGTSSIGLAEFYLKKDSALFKDNPHALDTAIDYALQSIQSYQGTVDEPYALNWLGKIYVAKSEFDQAIRVQQKAVDIARSLESTDDVALSLLGLAQTYQKDGQLKPSLSSYKEAEKLANETDAIYSLKDIYEGQSQIYGRLRDYANAYKYQYLLLGVKDTIYNIDQDKKLQAIQFNFDLQKKEGEINLLTKDKQLKDEEIKRQKLVRNGFVGGFAVVLLFAGIFLNQRNRISKEKKRSDELLLNILPEETAEELKATGTAKARSFESVSVLFTDFKNFTQASELLSPEELVKEINVCYSEFDRIITRHGIEKIKTIGDAYMCAGGIPVSNETHPVDVIRAGLEMQQFIAKNKAERIEKGQPYFELRLGIHTGPVVAGIVGIKKFAYDIWGDTVNTASRMESSGEIGKVNISGTTYELIKDYFICTHRGKVKAKNKGEIDMYFVEGAKDKASEDAHVKKETSQA